ncbi:MAG: hypothetical protein ABR536_05260 [Solirubrobacterales bacterium]
MASKKRKRRKQRPPRRPQPSPQAISSPAGPPRRGSEKEERPPAPWGSFPLSETVVAIGLLMLVGGLFLPPPRNKVVVGVGLMLGSLAGLELSAREHFAGYRSHTTLLAGACAVASVAAVLAIGPDSLPIWAALMIGLGAGGLAAFGLVVSFRRRSGGASFRLR